MSLYIVYSDGDNLLVSADSRVSAADQNNESCIITDNYTKIRRFGNKVIIAVDDVGLVEYFFSTLNNHDSVEEIINKAQAIAEKLPIVNAVVNTDQLGVYIFTVENNKTVMYQFFYKNNNDIFIDRQEMTGITKILTLGFYQHESLKYLEKLYYDDSLGTNGMIQKTYEHFADERIGGAWEAYIVNPNRIIHKKPTKIKDSKPLRRCNEKNIILSGNAIIGQNGTFEGIKIFDSDGSNARTTMDIGKYFDGTIEKHGIAVYSYNGNAYKNRILLDADVGIKVQKYGIGEFIDQFYVNDDGDICFKGDLTGSSGTFNDKLAIGTGDNIFKAEPDVGIWLGNSSFVDAPFKVTPAGQITATAVNINGSSVNTNPVLLTGNNAKFDLNNGVLRLGISDTNYKMKFDGTNLNFSDDVKIQFKGDKGDTGATGAQGIQGIQGVPGYVPSWVQDTSITGFNVSSPLLISNYLRVNGTMIVGSGTNTSGISGEGTTSTDIRFWAGDTYANRASAPFRVTQEGAFVASNADITGTITSKADGYSSYTVMDGGHIGIYKGTSGHWTTDYCVAEMQYWDFDDASRIDSNLTLNGKKDGINYGLGISMLDGIGKIESSKEIVIRPNYAGGYASSKYVSIDGWLGVNFATSPSYPLHVEGQTKLNGSVGIGINPDSGFSLVATSNIATNGGYIYAQNGFVSSGGFGISGTYKTINSITVSGGIITNIY